MSDVSSHSTTLYLFSAIYPSIGWDMLQETPIFDDKIHWFPVKCRRGDYPRCAAARQMRGRILDACHGPLFSAFSAPLGHWRWNKDMENKNSKPSRKIRRAKQCKTYINISFLKHELSILKRPDLRSAEGQVWKPTCFRPAKQTFCRCFSPQKDVENNCCQRWVVLQFEGHGVPNTRASTKLCRTCMILAL